MRKKPAPKSKRYTDGLYTWDDSYPKTFFVPYPTKDAQFVKDADRLYRGLI